MYAFLALDDHGAVTTDWVALTAGIIVLGMIVAYAVLGNSHGYVLDTFDQLNAGLEKNNEDLAALERSIDLNQ